ncbi:MAG: type VII secretion protein EccCa [Jatrophihabitans sp.]
MGTDLFRRPARRSGPVEPRGEIVLESPPELPESVSGGGAGQMLTYLPMIAGAGATGLLVTGSHGSPITYLASGMMALSMVGMAFGGVGRGAGEKRRRLDGERRDYQRYLEQVRRRVRRAAEQQRAASLWRHPDPDTLWCIAVGSRLWERRPGDHDFLQTRVGRGPQRLAVTLVPPETKPIEDLEPISSAALRRFVRTHGSVSDLPAALAFTAFGRIRITGPPGTTRGLVRAVIGQLTAFQSPDDVMIAVCTGGDAAAQWDWIKWLPHALSPDSYDAVGQVRLIGDDLLAVETMFGDTLTSRPRFGAGGGAGPQVVVVVDGGRVPPEAQLAGSLVQGVTAIDLTGNAGTDVAPGVLRLDVEGRTLSIVARESTGAEKRTLVGVADVLSVVEAESLARRMSPMRVSATGAEPTDALAVDLSLPDLLRIGDPRAVDPAVTWRPRAPRDRLRVSIGVGVGGQPVDLDIKESAQGGMGPHGLVIGATGSGKSELLRTLVLGLALTHSSETLNFVLVDFKGGATFASLDVMPHTSAVITNLEDELILVDRMKDAIQGELVRRQEALRAAGNYASLRDYERAREQGVPLEPMPSLFIVVDEFSELLSAKPDFIDLFVMIGRLGRSLGVHLLLASQRLEEGRLRGLDTHLSYRVGLRTFSGMESRVVLGVPDAYELPSAPGNGYLKEATEGLVRFKAAYVSGTYTKAASSGPEISDAVRRQVLPYQVDYLAPREDTRQLEENPGPNPAEPAGPGETMLDVLVARLEGAGMPARKVWLPPLDVAPSLDELLPPLGETELGLRPVDWDPMPTLSAPIGLIDRPFDQRRDAHWIDMASAHFVVVGRPQSGKSTVLRSLITGLALTHTPEQVQFFCLDFGGGTLTGLSDLPHVGSVATRLEPDRLRRTIAEVNTLLAAREELFTRHRIDSMTSYRRAVAAGRVPRDGFGDLFLVVDGWGTVRSDYEAIEAAITQIAGRGLGYGVHVVLSIQRWMEMRPALRDLISNKLELRLGDPSESEFDRKVALDVPEGSPGRGLSAHKLHFLSALPRIDSRSTVDDVVDGVADLVERVQTAWNGPVAPPVRLLPHELPYPELPASATSGSAVPIGVDEDILAPVFLDFDSEPHFIAIGDVESGKSNLLRVIARGITNRWTPEQAKIITFDYRRGLLGAVSTTHQIGYVMNSVGAPQVVSNIVAALKDRLEGIQVDPTAGQVPTWNGPHLFLLIDDYDLIASSSQGNPMHAINEFLPQARDIGLHVVLSRQSGGSGQGMFEPFMRNLRDMGSPGILLSGSKDEGAVLGSVKMEPLRQGRGRLVHRRLGAVLIQTAKA